MDPRTAAVLNTCQAFGLTKQASVAFARVKQAADIGGDFDLKEDAKGVGAHALAHILPFGSTALGVYLADKAKKPIGDGAIRAIGGSIGGGMLGSLAGSGVGAATGMTPEAQAALSILGGLTGGGLGGHLATRQYWIPSKSKSDE